MLCALRAKNRGADVVLATSADATDDRLAAAAAKAGLRVLRGPLDDVLARFQQAAAGLPDDAVIVRLTADNAFPDGRFVESLARKLVARKLEYLGTSSPLDGLPYGMSAEAFTARALRAAHEAASSPHDREHVTPWIKRHRGRTVFQTPGAPRGWGHLRCTLDDRGDYRRLVKVFAKIKDPIGVSWEKLCLILQKLPGEPAWRVPFRVRGGEVHGELALGAAQLGMNYGIVNASGKPSWAEARAMVRRAVAHGVTAFDTARDYADSEKILGRIMREDFPGRGLIVTKLGALRELADVERSVRASCANLSREPLDALLLHHWSQRAAFGGRAWRRLLELKKDGFIKKLGASVYLPEEGLAALADPDVSLIQIPFNILDRRWKDSGFLEKAGRRPEVLIHVRSVLLQGLLAAPARHWAKTGVEDAGLWAPRIAALAKDLRRDGPLDLCLAYVRAQPWLTSVVLGMESRAQLEVNLALFRKRPLTPSESARCERELAGAPERLLNPSLWARNAAKTKKEPKHGSKK
ncbi:MAG: aldo/keto reductase [Elusimicrobia bacterium]|nr:aldo/keto reductase [Elusimicrobiota bacterium]